MRQAGKRELLEFEGGRTHRGNLLDVSVAAHPSPLHEVDQHAGTLKQRDPSSNPGGADLPERGIVSTPDPRTGR